MKTNSRSVQVDNGDLESKIALREHFLEKYHKGTHTKVLDCCAGQQQIWKRLRAKYDVDYLVLDKKEIPGTLKIDSIVYLEAGHGIAFDIIDVDTYGLPYRHFSKAVQHLNKPTTFFGTVNANGMTKPQAEETAALGITCKVPDVLIREAATDLFGEILGAIMHPHVIEYAALIVATRHTSMRTKYVGVRVVPR